MMPTNMQSICAEFEAQFGVKLKYEHSVDDDGVTEKFSTIEKMTPDQYFWIRDRLDLEVAPTDIHTTEAG